MVCWWLLVHSGPANGTLFCGQEDLVNSNMGRTRRKKKVGWFERFSLRYCGQQKQEFRAGMKILISSSKENKQTKLLIISALPWFSGQPGLRVLRLLYPM
jgi:hypothetical protein